MGSGMMMGMPFGGQMPSQFGFGYGGFGNQEASDSVTVTHTLIDPTSKLLPKVTDLPSCADFLGSLKALDSDLCVKACLFMSVNCN